MVYSLLLLIFVEQLVLEYHESVCDALIGCARPGIDKSVIN